LSKTFAKLIWGIKLAAGLVYIAVATSITAKGLIAIKVFIVNAVVEEVGIIETLNGV
jgi:hypothetical protein